MIKGTTILSVRSKGKVAIGGDGQVTFGETVLKRDAVKIRKLSDGKVIVGFAGATADSFALMERFEEFLNQYQGSVKRAAIELAKQWRTDRALRRLEAVLAIVDDKNSLIMSGTGDVIEPEEGVIGIGSGGQYAAAAAKALLRNTKLSAKDIVTESLKIASEICIYTNNNIYVEEL
ncbi:MAG: ATP-dependent protease subunit HslV [Planctomycetota bacterium]